MKLSVLKLIWCLYACSTHTNKYTHIHTLTHIYILYGVYISLLICYSHLSQGLRRCCGKLSQVELEPKTTPTGGDDLRSWATTSWVQPALSIVPPYLPLLKISSFISTMIFGCYNNHLLKSHTGNQMHVMEWIDKYSIQNWAKACGVDTKNWPR